MKIIARIRSDFPEKFGIPRQSGLIEELKARIVFRAGIPQSGCAARSGGIFASVADLAVLGSYSGELVSYRCVRRAWEEIRGVGVFATRSPFRPNPIGLSSVKILSIDFHTEEGPVIMVAGADLMDQTPIYDIKPYLPHVDSHPEARGGFAYEVKDYGLNVDFPEEWKRLVPAGKQEALTQILEQDPRPSYQQDPERVYGMSFAGCEVKFRVEGQKLKVIQVIPLQ